MHTEMNINMTLVYLKDISWTPAGLRTPGDASTPFEGESDKDIGTLISFYETYLAPMYSSCVFYQTYEENYLQGAVLKLFSWYKKHIDAINDINEWYTTNRAKLLSNELVSTSKTKTSDTPQDGDDYTDSYPTTQANTESTTQSRDNVSFLSTLAKRYHNYMADFADLFCKECNLYYEPEEETEDE